MLQNWRNKSRDIWPT